MMGTAPTPETSGDARLRILAEVSHSLAAITTDYQSVLNTIASICARLVGDGCLVTLLDAERQQLMGAANAHHDMDLEAVYREYVAGMGAVPLDGSSISAMVTRTGEPAFVPEIDPAALVARSEPALRPLLTRLDIRSFVVVPIRAHNAIIGTLSLMRTGPGRNYVREDVTLLQDLADRAGLAIDNARLYQELEQRVQQRTTELEIFSFAVANSIRAPLRTIAAFSDALYEDARDRLEPHSRDDLERIRTAVGRVRETVDSLLHLARLAGSELRRSEVNVSEIAAVTVERMRAAEPTRSIDLEVEPEIVVHADPRLVQLAVGTLLSNAWQSTRSRSDGQIAVTADRSGPNVAVILRDNGNLTAQHARVLLTGGSSSKSRPNGDFGVGLVIARQAIEQQGGRIEVISPELGGTSVRFTFSGGAHR